MGGVIYPPNVALDLTDIGVDGDSLRCLTPLILCCQADQNSNGGLRGGWRFPNGSYVDSRSSGSNMSMSREASSVLLHRRNNVMFPIGVYTCEVPDYRTTLRKLSVHLYVGHVTGKELLFDALNYYTY